tara:strand:+ start:41573 stop:42190 length:618 start_codon:yes stop_codon:yes gene_type:complete
MKYIKTFESLTPEGQAAMVRIARMMDSEERKEERKKEYIKNKPELKELYNRFINGGRCAVTILEEEILVDNGIFTHRHLEWEPNRNFKKEHEIIEETIEMLNVLIKRPEIFQKLEDALFNKPLKDTRRYEWSTDGDDFFFIRFIEPGTMDNDGWVIKIRNKEDNSVIGDMKPSYYELDKIYAEISQSIKSIIHEIINTKFDMKKL